MNDRPDWDSYFLGIATAVSARADCTRRKVGALIVWDNKIWATGYNGTPYSGQPGCLEGACPRGKKSFDELPAYAPYHDCISVHAEVNAIKQFRESKPYINITRPKAIPTVYVTDQPCDECFGIITRLRMSLRYPNGGFSLL